ncbi:MAG: SGNH/GDSL hydrolase family protein [Gammaproteobacteria bacterium]
MKKVYQYRKFPMWLLSVFLLLGASESIARQGSYDGIVVFGGSLSDTGNVFVILSDPSGFGFDETCNPGTPLNVPPYDSLDILFIPDGVYAKGGHHVTNGATYIEQLARGQGLAGFVRPALRNGNLKARNYAVGGARANDYPCRFNLSDQLDEYFSDFSESSPDTLFVFEIGGNDLRDILAGEIPPGGIGTAIGAIQTAIENLYDHGARHFLLVNVPNFGQTPAVQIIDQISPGAAAFVDFLATTFNGALASIESGLEFSYSDIQIHILDLYALFDHILAHPENYGIEVTNAPCVTPGVPPYQCRKPDSYLFWDGIHPTKTVHEIMAQEAAEILTMP